MHYKNGREVKVGDRVVGRDWGGQPVSGIVVSLLPNTATCNMGVIPVTSVGVPQYTSSEFMHLDDAVPQKAGA